MASKIAQEVKDFLLPSLTKLEVELVEVEYKKMHNGMNLTIFIDAEGGIDLNKCEEVHKVVDVLLDELDPTNGSPYTLNVSSVGLDYPLKTDADFKRNLNKEVEASLFCKLNGKKDYIGTLVDFNENNIIIETENEKVEVPRNAISKITKYISI